MEEITIFIIIILVLIFILSIGVGCSYYVPVWYKLNMKPFYTPLDSLPINKNSINPKRVCIFMVVTPEISDYSRYSIDINRKYCEKYNYTFRLIEKNLTPDLKINFSKLQATLDLMDEKNKKNRNRFDYIIHIDADAIIHNQNYEITNLISKYMIFPVSFLASEDCYKSNMCSQPGKMNSGVYIVRNNLLGKGVINTWLNSARTDCSKYKDKFPNCQLVFWNCVMPKMFFSIKILPYNALNGKDGLWVYHMMQGTSRERIDEMREIHNYEFSNERQKVYN